MEIKRINRRKFVGQSVALSASMLSYKAILGANERGRRMLYDPEKREVRDS